MATKSKKTFFVSARIALDTDLEIYARSLDEALEIAKGMKITEFIEIQGGHNDSKLAIIGVFESNGGLS